MDLVVHLSRREGLPRVLPQALAASRPIVAYDCDGAREVCFDNETGFLIPFGVAGHGNRILRLAVLSGHLLDLARDAGLRLRFGKRGQQFVREHFSVERMVEDIYRLYLKLAAEHGLPRT